MKEIRETKMVEQTTVKFVADDGKEFDDSLECEIYEAKKNRKLLFAKLSVFMHQVKLPFFDWLYYKVYELTPRNEEDLINLYSYYGDLYWDGFEEMCKQCPIGETVTLVCNDDWMNFYKANVNDEIKELAKPSKKSGKSEKYALREWVATLFFRLGV